MLYTVKEVAALANVTVKTLHHYHKIGLLLPCEVSDAGYRLYGTKELERLQQILFYRELDFSLKEIKRLLQDDPDRSSILSKQKELLLARKRRLERLIQTIDESLDFLHKGELMDKARMFIGFASEAQWRDALREQHEYLHDKYGYNLLSERPLDVDNMNQQAVEATRFLKALARALAEGVPHHDERVQTLIRRHLDFLNQHGHPTSAADFAARARFFVSDDFHRRMMESLQTGLAYYLCVAAESYALGSETGAGQNES
ncbi:MerR family transcriptional regulator [Alicyclobacillus shizuokensis]|uniref:MerR family transcriptional regulator n=1 Tax=Alicyclobacillus shizuokensis TaxID=392014 RepID=UPI000831857B|nr:MerR family transcriptional regulator [Alicyclobacillus shizuokensis]MCL6625543.1 MerR family transcriptional regulator [Alicyclobacillus shizuokensis]